MLDCQGYELDGLRAANTGKARKTGLKIPYPQGCEGSTPSSGTTTCGPIGFL
jgi:hypothetical protein